jgi:hypothetical protein
MNIHEFAAYLQKLENRRRYYEIGPDVVSKSYSTATKAYPMFSPSTPKIEIRTPKALV